MITFNTIKPNPLFANISKINKILALAGGLSLAGLVQADAGERLTFTEDKVTVNSKRVNFFYKFHPDLASLSEVILVPGQAISKVIEIGSDANVSLQLVSKFGGSNDSFYGTVQRGKRNTIIGDSLPLRVNGELIIPEGRNKLDITSSLALFDSGTDINESGTTELVTPFGYKYRNGVRMSLERIDGTETQLRLNVYVPKRARNEIYEIVYSVANNNRLYTLGDSSSQGLKIAASTGNTDALREELLERLASLGNEVGVVGGVYSLTNSVDGNGVAVFDRFIDGSLEFTGNVEANGIGHAIEGTNFNPLDSQSAIVVSEYGNFVIGVNAGSDEVFVMRVNRDTNELTFADKAYSGGDLPISVAIYNDLIYVVNGGENPNISGFKVSSTGQLAAIPGSTRSLGPGGESPIANAAERTRLQHEIVFNPTGDRLVVVESGTNSDVIHVFGVDSTGLATERVTSLSDSENPLAMAFTSNGSLLVTESADDESVNAVTSYQINDDLSLSIITGAVNNFQEASCWLVGANDVFYTVNSLTNNLSSYGTDAIGQVSLINEAAGQLLQGPPPVFDDGFLDVETLEMTLANGTAPPFPTDATISTQGRFLYTLNLGNSTISAFAIQTDGSLEFIADYEGEIVPFGGGQGMASR